jgi:hypothetical protein
MWITRLLTVIILSACWAFYSPPAWADLERFTQVTLQDAVSAGTADGTALPVDTYTSVGVQVTISATGTVVFEATGDGTNWVAKLCTLTSDASAASSVTASGLYQCNVAGMQQFRARISANSGTITVIARASTAIFSGGGGGGTTGWPTASTTKEITWANSLANAARIGDGVTPICLYTDATLGPQVRPCTDANVLTIIPANFTWSLWDVEGAAAIETVDPDAASKQAIWTYASAYRPLKSVYFPAGALNTDGTQCGQPTERTINSGALRYTIICTDNDASTIYGEAEMPDGYDGSTVTLMGSFVQTAADTAVLNADVAMACRANGDTINNTWGTEIAMDIAAMGGSNKINTVTTAAITPNGTCTGPGTLLQFRWQLDAGGTTTAVATLHVLGFKLVYATKSRSD